MHKKMKALKGKLLVAEPFLKDEYFIRSVVLLVEHHAEGSFGFILNRPIELTISDAIEGFPPFDAPVFLGGPVSRDNIYYIHTFGHLISGSQEVVKGLNWGGEYVEMVDRIKDGTLNKDTIRFFAGYSGWEKGQLDKEIKEKSWLVTDVDPFVIMYTPPEQLWKKVLSSMGDEYAEMANYPIDPSLN